MKPGDEILIRAKLINVRERDNEATVGFDSTTTAVVPLGAVGAAERGLREALELYLRTYADTQTHPTVVEEANCINVARAALAATDAPKETHVHDDWGEIEHGPGSRDPLG